jgi:hypothetical protein
MGRDFLAHEVLIAVVLFIIVLMISGCYRTAPREVECDSDDIFDLHSGNSTICYSETADAGSNDAETQTKCCASFSRGCINILCRTNCEAIKENNVCWE